MDISDDELPIVSRTLSRAEQDASRGQHVGRASRKRVKATLQLLARLRRETRQVGPGRWEGPLRPCTIVNFNPEWLVLEGQIRQKIPPAGFSDRHVITVNYEGREFKGHYLYLTSPVVYLRAAGHIVDDLLNIDVPDMTPAYFSPHAIGCEFWAQYVEGSASSKQMGGVLMFDGDPHRLSETNLAHNNGKILVPTREMLADDPEPSYTVREVSIEEELARLFERQRAYCDLQVQVAHSLHITNDPMQQASITDTMREWARYAVSHYWMKELPEWVKARITAAGVPMSLVRCKECGTQQPSPEVFKCPKCAAPYDPFKAFMAGVVVPQAYLELLEGDELETVQREIERRRAKFKNQGGRPRKNGETGAGGAETSGDDAKEKES